VRAPRRAHYLLCAPDFYEVCYSINPWMNPTAPVFGDTAQHQWKRLHDELIGLGHQVELIEPVPGLPDMVFAANGAIVADGRALVARFRHPQRAAESGAYLEWFRARGYQEVRQSEAVNEGEGDFLRVGRLILGGWGHRSDPAAYREVAEFFDTQVLSLQLVDPRFYHLDTALAVLDEENVAYLPQAFAPESLAALRDRFPDALLVDPDEAGLFALNAVSDGLHILISRGARRFADMLRERGYEPIATETTELLKAGGGAKCCVLELHGDETLQRRGRPAADVTEDSQSVETGTGRADLQASRASAVGSAF
jgi:N-dimethylarginine dimethylaminohydrolase